MEFEVCEVLNEEDGMTKGYILLATSSMWGGTLVPLTLIEDTKQDVESIRESIQKDSEIPSKVAEAIEILVTVFRMSQISAKESGGLNRFGKEEQLILLEAARIALSDAQVFDDIVEATDITDETMADLRDHLEKFMNEETGT